MKWGRSVFLKQLIFKSIKYSIIISLIASIVTFVIYITLDNFGDFGVSYATIVILGDNLVIETIVWITTGILFIAIMLFMYFFVRYYINGKRL